MAFTAKEENKLKKIALERAKDDAIKKIMADAEVAKQPYRDSITAIDTQKNLDIAVIKNATTVDEIP